MYLKVSPDNRGLYTYGSEIFEQRFHCPLLPLIPPQSTTHQRSRMKRLRGEHAITDSLCVRLLRSRLYIGTPTYYRNYTSVE